MRLMVSGWNHPADKQASAVGVVVCITFVSVCAPNRVNIYIYIYMAIYIHIYIIHTSIRHACMHVCMHARMHGCICICVYVYVYIYVCVCDVCNGVICM